MQAICSSLLPVLLPFACTSEASFVSFSSGIHAVLILLVFCNINEKHMKLRFEFKFTTTTNVAKFRQ
jgi:hypothetical protein